MLNAIARPSLSLRQSLVLFGLNVAGSVLYVVRSAKGWRIQAEHGAIPVTGEPFVWFAAIIPVVTFYFLMNATWGGIILQYRRWRSGIAWLAAAAVWSIAIAIDFAHH